MGEANFKLVGVDVMKHIEFFSYCSTERGGRWRRYRIAS